MAQIRIPDILTDLAHVGNAGLPQGGSPILRHEVDICRQWGYPIEQEGDRIVLRFDNDQIVPYWIQRETPDIAWGGLRVSGYLETDSTNREALVQAQSGAPGGTLICAEKQTAGRGRQGREWYSPAGGGLYFSLIIRPQHPEKYWPLLTHAASIALVRTLRNLVNTRVIPNPLDIDIKWPNDVMISGKKCAGILLETVSERSNRAVVVGVGINVRPGSVPKDLSDEAICVDTAAGVRVPRRKILVGFLERFQLVYISLENENRKEILESWKKYSTMWDGVPVWIEEGGCRRSAVTCGLDEVGALIVQTEEGSRETIHAGNVRIRQPRQAG